MYSKIFDKQHNHYADLTSARGKKILNKYLEFIERGDQLGGNLEEIYALELEERVHRSFEQNYDNTFWVSCHGIYENAKTFRVPYGCKLIFTTWLGKLGEGGNYQENAIFRDLQAKNPLQFIETDSPGSPLPPNKTHPVLPEILQKDNTWGRDDMALFSDRVIYNEGDECPDLQMKMDNDCWKQGFYAVPIQKKLNYYMDDDDGTSLNCYPENKDGADYWWEAIVETGDDGQLTEGANPSWKSHMSKKLRKNLPSKERKKTIKSVFTTGDSDSTEPDKTKRWGSQRSISNVLTELTDNNIRGVFLITLCRPGDTNDLTYYDPDKPRTLITDEALLTRSDLDNINRIEKRQKAENIQYQEIYNRIKNVTEREALNSLKQLPDAAFLEYLPHYESDISKQRYKKNIVNILYGRAYLDRHDGVNDDEIEDWMDILLDTKIRGSVPPIQEPTRVSDSITGSKLSGTDNRHSRLLLHTRSLSSIGVGVNTKKNELRRRGVYLKNIYDRWGVVAKKIAKLNKQPLSAIKELAKEQYIVLSTEGHRKKKMQLIIEMAMDGVEIY